MIYAMNIIFQIRVSTYNMPDLFQDLAASIFNSLVHTNIHLVFISLFIKPFNYP